MVLLFSMRLLAYNGRNGKLLLLCIVEELQVKHLLSLLLFVPSGFLRLEAFARESGGANLENIIAHDNPLLLTQHTSSHFQRYDSIRSCLSRLAEVVGTKFPRLERLLESLVERGGASVECMYNRMRGSFTFTKAAKSSLTSLYRLMQDCGELVPSRMVNGKLHCYDDVRKSLLVFWWGWWGIL